MSLLPFGSHTKNVRASTLVIAASNSQDKTRADYVCTGSGDQTTINTALAALPSGTGKITLLDGLYTLSGAITCGGGGGTSAVVIEGQGWNTQIKIANSTNIYAFDFGSAGSPQFTMGLTLKDFYLNCNGANQSSAGGGIYARGAVWCKFDHLFIQTPWEAGIRFYQDGTGSYGHHNSIVDCLFRDGKNSNGGQGWAIKFEQADENHVVGCTFQDNCNALGQGHDGQIYDTSAGLQSIIGNAFVNGGTGAAFIQTNSNPGRLQIIGNEFDSPVGANNLEINGNSNIIVGNVFLGIGNGAGSNVEGIHIGGVSGTIITGNQFTSSNAHAIAIVEDPGSTGNVITGNTLTGTWASGPITLATSSTTTLLGNPGTGDAHTDSEVAKSSNYTLTPADSVVIASGVGTTITLPTAVGIQGRIFTVKRVDASNNTTVNTTSAQTIDGSTSVVLKVNYQSLSFISDNANWQII